MAEQRWRAAEILRLGIGEGQQLVYSRATYTARVLPRPQAALLASCKSFRTIDEHARAAANDQTALADARLQLEMLAREGLLISEEDLIAGCMAARTKAHPGGWPLLSLSTVSVVTADRVASLQRCLSSYVKNAQTHERRSTYLVLDDARTAAARTATQQMLSALARDRDADIVYAGADEKRALAAALTADGEIPSDVVDFALFDPEGCGRSTGANHNAQLLYTAGEAFLSVDDDSTARLGQIAGAEPGLALSSEYQAPATKFFPDRAHAVRAFSFGDGDVVAIHERLIGLPVRACIRDLSSANTLRVDQLGSGLERWISQARARVLVTQTGLVGDAGTPNLPALSRLTGESWARFVATESGYRDAMRGREMMRGRTRLTITDNPFLSTGPAIAIDGRKLLPPFFPVLRNSDGIFGLTLRTTVDGACIAHLPWALEHAPEEHRTIEADAPTSLATRCVMHEIITAAIHSLPTIPGGRVDIASRITALGRHLRSVGSLESRAFLEFVRPWVWRAKSASIAALEEDLAEHDHQPSYWATDVRRYIETLREALAADAYFVPGDLPPSRSHEESIELTRRLVQRFGDVLTWWPAIVKRARRLRAEGPLPLKRL
jgi:hypothetical protein